MALGSFVVAGILVVLLLASLSTSWGVAYGQSAGPTPTSVGSNTAPTYPCTGTGGGGTGGSTTPGSGNTGGTPGGSGNTGGSNSNPNCATSTTPPSAVDNSNTSPTTAPAAVNDANQAPVGVVPGLPHTGSQAPASDDIWKYGVLALLALNMVVAVVVMRRTGKSSKSR